MLPRAMSSSICGATADPLAQPLGEDQRVVAEPQRVGARRRKCRTALSVTGARPPRARRRTSGGGRPCRRPGRRTSRFSSGLLAVMSLAAAPPRWRRPPGGGCRRRGALRSAISASGACSEPTWTCDSPRLAADEHLPQRPAALGGLGRHGGPAADSVGRDSLMRHSPADGARRRACGVGGGGLADPRALLVGGDAGARSARRCTAPSPRRTRQNSSQSIGAELASGRTPR